MGWSLWVGEGAYVLRRAVPPGVSDGNCNEGAPWDLPPSPTPPLLSTPGVPILPHWTLCPPSVCL